MGSIFPGGRVVTTGLMDRLEPEPGRGVDVWAGSTRQRVNGLDDEAGMTHLLTRAEPGRKAGGQVGRP